MGRVVEVEELLRAECRHCGTIGTSSVMRDSLTQEYGWRCPHCGRMQQPPQGVEQ